MKLYFQNEDNSNVLQSHIINGYKLGIWVNTQRRKKNKLSQKRISKLNALNFVWEPTNEKWEKGFYYFEKYVKKIGNARVPAKFKTHGFWLGGWVRRQRIRKDELSPEMVSRLNSLGFVWKLKDYKVFHEARDYARCLKLKSQKEWKLFAKSRKNDPYIYYNPDTKYKDKGWISWSDWLGKE